MKKILLNSIVLASFALADTFIGIGAGSGKADNTDISEGVLTFGYSKIFDKIFTELSFDLGSGSDSLTFTNNLKIGYSIINDLSVYGIGSVGYQNINKLESLGFGYGAGVEYRITKSVKTQFEYKTFDMQNNSNSYNYIFSSLNLKYSF